MRLILASTLNKAQHKLSEHLNLPHQSPILCIPTAANVYAKESCDWLEDEMSVLREMGFELDLFDLAAKSPTELQVKLDQHRTIYITGGNSYYLLEHMQRSSFPALIKDWGQTNISTPKLYIGCSAGAVVACPRIDYIGDMDDIGQSTLIDITGLSLYDKLLMVHADHPQYGPKGQKLTAEWRDSAYTIVPLNDDQLLLYDSGKETIL